tara:strand:- start:49 stop:324 length:276 start_codon:yes stop_codon:yes gene_type:complete
MSDGIFDPNVSLDEVVGGIDTTMIKEISDMDTFEINDINIDIISNYKEYWIIGFLFVCILGYYTYTNRDELIVQLDKIDNGDSINENNKLE